MVRATFWSSKLSTPRSRRHWFCIVAILRSRSFLFHTGRSLDHRNPTGEIWVLIVCCSDCTPASFPYASAFFTHSHTLSLDSFCRPTAGKSSSPAGLFLPLCMRT